MSFMTSISLIWENVTEIETEVYETKLLMSMLQLFQGHERKGECQAMAVGSKVWPLNKKGYMEADSGQDSSKI